MWLPLLGLFIGLAWAGWNEYRKLEAYQQWAQGFERAKYDIYAVLGQKGDRLTWGYPTRQGPRQLQHISLRAVNALTLYKKDKILPRNLVVPKGGDVYLGITLDTGEVHLIPFTDADLAARWRERLQSLRQALESTSSYPS